MSRKVKVVEGQGVILPLLDICPRCKKDVDQYQAHKVAWIQIVTKTKRKPGGYGNDIAESRFEQRAIHRQCADYCSWRPYWFNKGDWWMVDIKQDVEDLLEDFKYWCQDQIEEAREKALEAKAEEPASTPKKRRRKGTAA